LVVAAAGVAGLVFMAPALAGPPDSVNAAAQNDANRIPQLPDGFIQKDENADSGVKSTLVGLTQRAVTKNSYDSFFSSFLSELDKREKADAEQFKGVNQDQLNSTIARIQSEWRDKYNQDFDINDKNLVFDSRYTLVQGEVSDARAAAASEWPLSATADRPMIADARQQQRNARELSSGRAVAVMCFPPGNGMPAMRVSFIHQITGWYVDVPADRTGEQIYNDLTTQLNHIADNSNSWPSDVNDGYRMVAHRVVGALYGVSSQPGRTASAQ
jgi:hypothetical protein